VLLMFELKKCIFLHSCHLWANPSLLSNGRTPSHGGNSS
jgi:hypothetical protein